MSYAERLLLDRIYNMILSVNIEDAMKILCDVSWNAVLYCNVVWFTCPRLIWLGVFQNGFAGCSVPVLPGQLLQHISLTSVEVKSLGPSHCLESVVGGNEGLAVCKMPGVSQS